MFRTRDERRRNYPQALARPLQERIDMEFIEQPLGPGLRFISAASQVPVRVADANLADEPITFRISGVPLDVLLDLVSLEYGLAWEITEAGTILVKATPEPAIDGEGPRRQ